VDRTSDRDEDLDNLLRKKRMKTRYGHRQPRTSIACLIGVGNVLKSIFSVEVAEEKTRRGM